MCKYCKDNTKVACVSSIPLIVFDADGEEAYEYDYHETIIAPKNNATLFQDTSKMQNNTSYAFIYGSILVSRFYDSSYLGEVCPAILEYHTDIAYCPICGRNLSNIY